LIDIGGAARQQRCNTWKESGASRVAAKMTHVFAQATGPERGCNYRFAIDCRPAAEPSIGVSMMGDL
jgi:hypothetical protein